MNPYTNPTEVQARIAELEVQASQPGHHPTEIYTRIVGYYRSLANWNAGKREEYNHRVTFSEAAATQPHAKSAVATWVVFVKENCPQCPAMKSKLPLLPMAGTIMDIGTTEGFESAVRHEVLVTPTLILLDANQEEVLRITSARDWNRVETAV